MARHAITDWSSAPSSISEPRVFPECLRAPRGPFFSQCRWQVCPAAGIIREQVDAINDHGNGPFSAAEHAVLRYADQMLLTNTEGLYQALREHFDDAQICELGVCMAVIGGMAKLSFVLDLVEKESYCAFGNSSATSPAP